MILIIAVISILPEPAADESPYVLSDGTTVQFRCAYLVANDADALAAFYQTALGFTPANDNVLLQAYSEAAGGAKGVVLTAPGYTGGNAPELCIVSCESASEAGPSRVYDLGYPHLCFEADDIAGTLSAIEAAGGSVISKFSDNAKEVCFYAKDPAGNITRAYLHGSKAGTAEVIWKDLPGMCDGLGYDENGNIWCGLLHARSGMVDTIYKNPWMKHVLLRLPNSLFSGSKGCGLIAFDPTCSEVLYYTLYTGENISDIPVAVGFDGKVFLPSFVKTQSGLHYIDNPLQ